MGALSGYRGAPCLQPVCAFLCASGMETELPCLLPGLGRWSAFLLDLRCPFSSAVSISCPPTPLSRKLTTPCIFCVGGKGERFLLGKFSSDRREQIQQKMTRELWASGFGAPWDSAGFSRRLCSPTLLPQGGCVGVHTRCCMLGKEPSVGTTFPCAC